MQLENKSLNKLYLMKSQKLLVLLALVTMFFSLSAQNLTVGSAAYYEAMRIAYQTKIDWVQNNPEEHAMATESGWYEMAHANVQEMIQNKSMAEHSADGIFLPLNRDMNTDPEPGEIYAI